MRNVIVLGALLAAGPAAAADSGDDSVSVAPPKTARYHNPRWPRHLTPEQHYRRGKRERDVGLGIGVVGGVALTTGLVFAGLSLESMGRPCPDDNPACYTPLVYGVFAVLADVASVPFLAVGVPLYQRGNRRMMQAWPYMDFDAESGKPRAGVGVSVRF